MQYQIRTPNAAELAEFFSAVEGDLAANGLSMTADGDLLQFNSAVLAHLREHRTEDDDGYISRDEDASGLVLWVGGVNYMIEKGSQ